MIRYGRVDEHDALLDGAVLFERLLAPEDIKTLPNGRKMLRPYVVEGLAGFDDEIFLRLGPDITVEEARVVERHRLEFRSDARERMCRRIDLRAGEIRLRHTSPGQGQDGVHLLKGAEAEACLARFSPADPPPAGAFPLLEAEIGLTGADVIAVARAVADAAAAWKRMAAAIEARRLAAKRAVRQAADDGAAHEFFLAAMDEAHWPGRVD